MDMKRRRFLAAIPAAALAGCLGSGTSEPSDSPSTSGNQSTTDTSGTPTVRPETTEITGNESLSFGDWLSSEQLNAAIRVDDVRIIESYSVESDHPEIPDGEALALVKYTMKNVTQDKIREGLSFSFRLPTPNGLVETSTFVGELGEKVIPIEEISGRPTPNSIEFLESGDQAKFVCGTLVSADVTREGISVGYLELSSGSYMAVWRPS